MVWLVTFPNYSPRSLTILLLEGGEGGGGGQVRAFNWDYTKSGIFHMKKVRYGQWRKYYYKDNNIIELYSVIHFKSKIKVRRPLW